MNSQNNMKPKTILTTCIILIFIAGCISPNPKGTTTTSSLYKGTKGLELAFVKNAPPSRVFASVDEKNPSQFKVIVNIKNKGAYDIGFDENGAKSDVNKGILVLTPEGGYVNLIGVEEQEDVKNDEKKKVSFDIRGISLSNNIGDELNIHSTLEARELSSLSAMHTSSIFATICYLYQTKVSTSACIDPDIYGQGPGTKACEAKNLAFSGGQGAPVAVTNIEVQMVPQGKKVKPQFLIHVENKGNGEVVKKEGYAKACDAEIGKSDPLNNFFNVVKIQAKLSTETLNCKQGDYDNIVLLDGKKGIIKCSPTKLESENKAYLAPLSIVLDYGYTKTISKDFKIERPG